MLEERGDGWLPGAPFSTTDLTAQFQGLSQVFQEKSRDMVILNVFPNITHMQHAATVS